MKKKNKQKTKRGNKRQQPDKGSLWALTEYFGSYLTALEIVSARQ